MTNTTNEESIITAHADTTTAAVQLNIYYYNKNTAWIIILL